MYDQLSMKKPTNKEIKRKIDSKIFALQSSLLVGDGNGEVVTEALLRECSVMFRPSHLQDIVIERSEAEGRCGWPRCGNALPAWRLSAPLVFELSEGEQLGRFCDKACMAKTKALLSAIPSTPPYSRENVVNLVCPSTFPAAGGELAAAVNAAPPQKKVYKRARRRDMPPSAKPVAVAAAAADGCTSGGGGNGGEILEASDPKGGRGAEVLGTISDGAIPDGDSVGMKKSASASEERQEAGDESGVEVVRTAMEGATISVEKPSDGVSSSCTVPSVATDTAPAKLAAAATPTVSAAPPVSDASWGNLRLSRSNGTPSAVSVHASLAAAASAMATAPASIAPDRSTPTTISSAAATSSQVSPQSCGLEATQKGDGGDEQHTNVAAVAQDDSAGEASALPRRRSVSFAEGTKDESPPPPESSVGTFGKRLGRRKGSARRGGAGAGAGRNGSGSGGKKGSAASPTSRRASVMGGVIEKTPAAPAPMEVEAGPGAEANARGTTVNAGMVEGHLPKFKADLSFHVMPRGYGNGNGNGAFEGGSGDGDRGAEVDTEEEEEDDGVHEDGDDAREGAGSNADDDENDKAIWRETFGEEMPADVSQGSWVDMDAVHDKEMREKFASSIASFTLLWSALSEWVTAETRAVCRAGRKAALAVAAAANPRVRTPTRAEAAATISDTDADVVADPTTTTPPLRPSLTISSHPANFEARKAGAVAEAIETEARRHTRWKKTVQSAADNHISLGKENPTGSSGDRQNKDGPTLSEALRHSGVSTMVNMHLTQAERALKIAAGEIGGVGDGDADAGGRFTPSRKNWVWSDTAEQVRKGARPGGWIEETLPKVERTSNEAERPSVWGQTRGDESASTESSVGPVMVDRTRGGGGAECRRAVAAVIDTLDANGAGRASAAANLSIRQWKVVPLVLLTAIGLGGDGDSRKCGGDPEVVSMEEAKAGAEACTRLCRPEVAISAREFQMLVEVFLEE